MKLSERILYEINTNPKLPPSVEGVAVTLEGIADEAKKLEALVDEQNKLLDTFRRKLDKLEQETVPQLKAEKETLRGYATHKSGCYENGDKCICGLDALLTEDPSDTPVSDTPASP